MRPTTLGEFVGQEHLIGPGKPLSRVIEQDRSHSFVLWGPPGTGKTTLARILAEHSGAAFVSLSAVLSGVKDIRLAVDAARARQASLGQRSIVFVDEVHRFNKGQQDAFLPHIEDGTITFIGATTENPSFELNNALLSRTRVYVLKPLEIPALCALLQAALTDTARGLGGQNLQVAPGVVEYLARLADGDARRAFNLIEVASDLATEDAGRRVITQTTVEQVSGVTWRRFDKGGDAFYDQISALHKAVRGSSPDAALYWLARMLDGGCDPLYVARRMLRMASEDIGNADPRALGLALDATQVYERLGSPEGELALAQAAIYLAVAPKSNASYTAFAAAREDARTSGSLPPPLKFRNAPTALMKQLGYGEGYKYDHDEPHAHAAGESYFPDELEPRVYYRPTDRGLEARIAERLAEWRARDATARGKAVPADLAARDRGPGRDKTWID